MKKQKFVLTRKLFVGSANRWMQPGELLELTEAQASSPLFVNRIALADAELEVATPLDDEKEEQEAGKEQEPEQEPEHGAEENKPRGRKGRR